jgi:Na+-transporting NADH:ubiquinone oxidoreductase subunit B
MVMRNTVHIREDLVKIQKQQAMRNVLKGMIPLCLAAVYFYGWRFAAVLAVVAAAGVLGEYLMAKKYGLSMTESLFVSVVLFSLSLPPTIPLWIAALGMLFGVVFGKMVFGGFGKNIFNPAISARAFVYISFGGPLTGNFVPAVPGTLGWFPGGFGYWLSPIDSISNATPLVTGAGNIADMIIGSIPGSFGETSAILVILGGLYIVYKKAANWRIVTSAISSFLVMQTIFWLAGAGDAYNPLYALVSGSFLLGAFFMITDPVSASQTTDLGRWIYGALFGVLTVLIRTFSIWPAAITFAILLSNMFAPLLDYYIKERKKKRAAAKKGASA